MAEEHGLLGRPLCVLREADVRKVKEVVQIVRILQVVLGVLKVGRLHFTQLLGCLNLQSLAVSLRMHLFVAFIN